MTIRRARIDQKHFQKTIEKVWDTGYSGHSGYMYLGYDIYFDDGEMSYMFIVYFFFTSTST